MNIVDPSITKIELHTLTEADKNLMIAGLNFADALADKLRGDRNITQNLDDYVAWRDRVTSTIYTAVNGMIPTLPEVPVEDRERYDSIADLIGEENPLTLDEGELEQAVETLREAQTIAPLNEEEQYIFQALTDAYEYMRDNIGGYESLIREDHVDDKLNEDIQNYNFPEWVNDHLDWEDLYENVKASADSIEFNGYTYYALRLGY